MLLTFLMMGMFLFVSFSDIHRTAFVSFTPRRVLVTKSQPLFLNTITLQTKQILGIMTWIRLIIILAIVVAIVYYAMVLLQCFGVLSFTNRKITFKRMIIPLYYWFAPTNEKPINTKKS